MHDTIKKIIAGFWLCAAIGGLFCSSAYAAENNLYRAGYVIGFRDAETYKAKDPSITAGRYAEMKRDLLAVHGTVPRNFWRGLRDGFRDAVRAYRPKFTGEDVYFEELPEHLRP